MCSEKNPSLLIFFRITEENDEDTLGVDIFNAIIHVVQTSKIYVSTLVIYRNYEQQHRAGHVSCIKRSDIGIRF